MGTGRPHVEITAATLAGGSKNQDRYAHGDGWAFVLDGASSFATVQPEHDGGWYAERLKDALSRELTVNPESATVDIVARAIKDASSAHDDPETCPTSTVAMARWTAKTVEVYVLGDSSAVLIGGGGEEEITDSRLAAIAPQIRAEYRLRLSEGHGFDERHRELLQELQAQQASRRNSTLGYWIAGADPEAAQRGIMHTGLLGSTSSVVLATDGAAKGISYGIAPSWRIFTTVNLYESLRAIHQLEALDERAKSFPRSKPSDDKTVIIIEIAEPTLDNKGVTPSERPFPQ